MHAFNSLKLANRIIPTDTSPDNTMDLMIQHPKGIIAEFIHLERDFFADQARGNSR